MYEYGHIRLHTRAPATALYFSIQYTAAVDIYDGLAQGGVVEPNAEFRAAITPENLAGETVEMINATPGYLDALVAKLQNTLNEVALADVVTFIDAMRAAGTPEAIGATLWAEVESVIENVTNPGPSPTEEEVTCIELCVDAPGQADPCENELP